MLRKRISLLCAVLLCLWPHTARAMTERERHFPDLYKFPYRGRGDSLFSFHQPYEPDEDGDPVSGWVQLGTTMITSDQHGRDIVRLTATAQANQGILYAYTRTGTNEFNGYFDVQINTSPESHEAADGMALFFTGSRPIVGSAMGMSHTLPGLGLVIDTFSNSRTRMVPYLYAYIQDGHREWNPDTDGGDTELTKGCQLELNKPMRIFVKLVEGKLDVGVSLTPHSQEHWHKCFSVDNVRLPFKDGGYLAFAGETGHFYAAHEVHTASFLAVRPPHHHADTPTDYERERKEREDRERREHHERERADREHRERIDREHLDRERSDRERLDREQRERYERENHDYKSHHEQQQAPNTARSSSDATVALAGNLDRQVHDVFSSLTEHMRGYNDRDAEDTRQRLNGVRDMTAHMLQEVNRQRADLVKVVDSLSKLKKNAGDLAYSTTRFTSNVKSMQASIKALRSRTKEIHKTHEDIQENIEHHHDSLLELTRTKKSGSDSGFLILFGVLQLLLIAGALAFNKLSSGSRKMGRMV